MFTFILRNKSLFFKIVSGSDKSTISLLIVQNKISQSFMVWSFNKTSHKMVKQTLWIFHFAFTTKEKETCLENCQYLFKLIGVRPVRCIDSWIVMMFKDGDRSPTSDVISPIICYLCELYVYLPSYVVFIQSGNVVLVMQESV